jgi:hypothetical protein
MCGKILIHILYYHQSITSATDSLSTSSEEIALEAEDILNRSQESPSTWQINDC